MWLRADRFLRSHIQCSCGANNAEYVVRLGSKRSRVHLAVRSPTAAVGEEVTNGRIWPTPSVTGIRPARKLSGDELPDTAKLASLSVIGC